MSRSACRAAALVLMNLVLAACSEPVVERANGPHDAAAEMRPDLIVAAPAVAASEDVIELTFPQETMRGIHFVLEAEGEQSWQLIYHLISDANGDRPSSFLPGTENVGIPDVGVGGPGPDRLILPAGLPSGTYRICTGNARVNFCAPIEIQA